MIMDGLRVKCCSGRECLRVTGTPSLADERTADATFIFVYGGLMRGFDLHHHMAGATFVGEGWTPGTLVSLGRYPGLLAGGGKVRGEIYRLDDPAASLEALDDLEDFNPGDPDKSAYLRVLADVHAGDGATLQAWTYVYNQDAQGAPLVTSGDWRKPD
jgi:gamma-glutamylcyclotransferase (GGCT)/AIG2-like uncharacterized protein YtfP